MCIDDRVITLIVDPCTARFKARILAHILQITLGRGSLMIVF